MSNEKISFFKELLALKQNLKTRSFRIALIKLIKSLLHSLLYLIASLAYSNTCIADYAFSVVYMIYINLILLGYSLYYQDQLIRYYNSHPEYEKSIKFFTKMSYLQNSNADSDRVSSYFKNFFKLFTSFLLIPNEIIYSLSYLVNFVLKKSTLISNFFIGHLGLNVMKNLIILIEILINLASISISIVFINFYNSNCNTSVLYSQIFCLIFLMVKFLIKVAKFIYYNLMITKLEISIRSCLDKNLNEKLSNVVRGCKRSTSGCFSTQNCESIDLDHIICCHNRVLVKPKDKEDTSDDKLKDEIVEIIDKSCCPKPTYLVGFYPIKSSQLKINFEFTPNNQLSGKQTISFLRSIDPPNEEFNLEEDYYMVLAVLLKLKRYLVVKKEDFDENRIKLDDLNELDAILVRQSNETSVLFEEILLFDKEKIETILCSVKSKRKNSRFKFLDTIELI